ncbi:MAG: hypothetical protein DYG83_15010 [Candidatus Brocadia sp. AMX2]|uniref:Uncharacterized protein n=1 Tax=Candidatus Brocadia sinica JPN1 TaxID=1197129 RepID=A0ABQ0K1M9_9BACT|nr:hypothetical protein [Candidatus Brocadia sinica]KAA0242995.1 MAG: hypothetical protein EDM70_12355 [Candidatus Brocadia sp. AMX2]MBC6933702.1 hypothetical protein [Candidatus Brocadia sp.]MBL1168730.1 hypothetical protein [Candidatus Brocadia sp. AMX1]NOG42789.1 hypothetical protein [Planctomycetota bacterium]MCE7868101.1 hypothetical protein [Candidatus Brocadia sp. AMX2]
MENTKKCPLNLDGFRHFCPDDRNGHPSLEEIKTNLERRSDLYECNDLPAHLQREKELLQFIRTGERPKRIETKSEVVTQTPKVEPAPVPAISLAQQKAMDDLARLKAGVPFSRSYTPQATTERIEPQSLSFEESLIANWKNDTALQREFTSFNAYAAYMRAEAGSSAG